jgi:hypothetical protein
VEVAAFAWYEFAETVESTSIRAKREIAEEVVILFGRIQDM